jgi:NADH-quinone oxidoreductase subunit L
VLAGNFLVKFVGWEGVGISSYLLIVFCYERNSAATAGRKAFIVNRVGDWGLVVGILLVFFTFGTLDFREVAVNVSALPRETAGFGVVSGICALLLIGAIGKSAQAPLHVWLPDAMEGPTPVSALIHAATMVTAGVYMIARNAPLFEHAPLVMTIVATVGALTALMGATTALVQTDIKRALAYSTMSQLGLMFVAAGVGAFAAAVFHLLTHAFFKSLLFLGSGAVIQAMAGEQDMQRMGGLRKYMPVTFVTMTIGALAIAGVPPLSGFFSKDEILLRAFAGNRMLWSVLAVTSVLTALYMFRLIALTFYGAYRGAAWAEADVQGGTPWHGPREGSRAMTIPLMALAVGAIVTGFIGIPRALGGTNAFERFLAPAIGAGIAPAGGPGSGAPGGGLSLGLMFFSVLLVFAGMLVARTFYLVHPEMPARIAARWHRTHALLRDGYYLDQLYAVTIVRGVHAAARGLFVFDSRVVDGAVNAAGWLAQIAAWCSHMFDKHVVDGIVGGVAWTAERGSFLVRRLQTGLIQTYALLMVLGVFAFISIYLLAR